MSHENDVDVMVFVRYHQPQPHHSTFVVWLSDDDLSAITIISLSLYNQLHNSLINGKSFWLKELQLIKPRSKTLVPVRINGINKFAEYEHDLHNNSHNFTVLK